MPLIALGLRRAIAIKLMPKAFKAGMSASSFRQLLRGKGLQYRWSTILGDWRTTNEIEAKKDAYKFIRKDRVPSPRFFATTTWKTGKEYSYRLKGWTQLHPGEELKEEWIGFTSDKPLSAKEVVRKVAAQWKSKESEKYPKKLVSAEVVSFWRREKPPLEG